MNRIICKFHNGESCVFPGTTQEQYNYLVQQYGQPISVDRIVAEPISSLKNLERYCKNTYLARFTSKPTDDVIKLAARQYFGEKAIVAFSSIAEREDGKLWVVQCRIKF